MKNHAKLVASCGMMTAVCVVLMLLGAVLELGIYAAPMFAGLCLVPLGEKWGRKYQTTLWLSVSLISFLLVPNVEENLIFFGFFGWYPIVRPKLERLPKALKLPVKLIIFNCAICLVEYLCIYLLVPEDMTKLFLLVLLGVSNLVFLLYDSIVPKTDILLKRLFHHTK